jgi:choline dehydrogenase-like flavoprotein
MSPGTATLPGAAEVDVAGTLSRYVGGLPPAEVKRMRLALRAFEWMPFPWRFSRASIEARQDFLAWMESSPVWWRQDILLLMKVLAGLGYGRDPKVIAAIGYEMKCEVEGDEPRGPAPDERPLGELTPPREGEDCDVVIVGSGAGGAVAATILAEAGLEVVVLEAGPYMDRRTYPTDPLEALETMYRDNGLTIAMGRPMIPVPVGRAVGGTTVINSGTCFRTPEHVLDEWEQRFGIAWASDLDPEFAQAEEMLDVKPVDVTRMGRNGQVVMEGASKLGFSHKPLLRNAGRCVRCSSCPAGCRKDAKRAMHVTYLPRAVAAGARIRSGVDVREVLFEGDRASGVRGLATGANGSRPRPFEVRARSVVLAGGALGTPELLLRSGVNGDHVGRHLRIHPAAWIGARFNEEIRGWDGVMQSYLVDEWKDSMGIALEATFTPLAFGTQWLPGTGAEHSERVEAFDRLGSNGVHLSDTSSGRVRLGRDGRATMGYRLNREDSRKLVFGIARAAEIFFAAGATEVYSQVRGAPIIRPGEVADFEALDPPADALRLEAFHPMGTARMAADPAEGAVGTDGAVHGRRDLYVADGSLLPSSLGVNPMITIIAMASRVARQLAERKAG